MYSSPRDEVLSSILENSGAKFFEDLHAGTNKGWSLLLTSITLGHQETALQLLANRAQPIPKDSVYNALHLATEFNRTEVIEWLANNGMHIDGDSECHTPLVHGIVSLTTSPETIRLLLKMGADWKRRVRCVGQDMSLLALASRLSRWEVAEVLLSCGAGPFPDDELQPFAAALRGTKQQKRDIASCKRFLSKLLEAGVTLPSTITVELPFRETRSGPLLSGLIQSGQYEVLEHLLQRKFLGTNCLESTAWKSILSGKARYLALLLRYGTELPSKPLEETIRQLQEVWDEPDAATLQRLVEKYSGLAGTLQVLVHHFDTSKPNLESAQFFEGVPQALVELVRTKRERLKDEDILARMKGEFRIEKRRKARKVMDKWWLEKNVERIVESSL
ncbi:ankyrin 3 [Apiospora arundinis]|uniref:Ankyrin 3 n=1 Tax=Apiospora arundinis TaxID=335852 RepID=A0ABR2J360_9PEZI